MNNYSQFNYNIHFSICQAENQLSTAYTILLGLMELLKDCLLGFGGIKEFYNKE